MRQNIQPILGPESPRMISIFDTNGIMNNREVRAAEIPLIPNEAPYKLVIPVRVVRLCAHIPSIGCTVQDSDDEVQACAFLGVNGGVLAAAGGVDVFDVEVWRLGAVKEERLEHHGPDVAGSVVPGYAVACCEDMAGTY
jgi:hypothetical protein